MHAISAVTYLELLQGMRSKAELEALQKSLAFDMPSDCRSPPQSPGVQSN